MSDILAAGYNTGDKRRDVTDILKKKIKNGNLTVPVNEGEFTSIFSSSETYSLSDEEKAEINKQAEEECKGANDMTCIQATKSRLMDSKLQEKQKLAKLPENYLYIIQRGTRPGEQPIVSVIPEKGTLQMRNGKVQTKDVEQVSSGPSLLSMAGKLLTGFIATFGTFIGVATFAFSIFLVWNSTEKYGYSTLIKYVLVAVSVFLPYSGYFLSLGMWILRGYKSEVLSND